ncbi:MAG: MBL fold metallo-hydrolase [Candidatus Limiplasma sp.]|nr:MBL fold metallo-hydrolase [Candidatus Limiplasma sp.]
MILRYYGHSQFALELESGAVVVTDPYGSFYAYPEWKLSAQVVTVSHHHHDHDAVDWITGNPTVIDRLGRHVPLPELTVTGIASWHDAQGGAKRGGNVVFRIEAENLSIVHLGDLGHTLTERQCREIGAPDVLLTPVGGKYTTDAETALENVRLLNPRITIPMHYQTQYSTEMPIQPVEPFLALLHSDPQPMRLCRLTRGDLSEQPTVIRMDITV